MNSHKHSKTLYTKHTSSTHEQCQARTVLSQGIKQGINMLRLNIKYMQEKQGQTEHPLPVSTNLSSVANSVAPRSSAITPIISCSRLLPAKHTSRVYTDLHTNGALITAQPLTKHTQLHHLYLSGALTTAQPLTKHSYTIFISAGHSLQPSPWQNTATPSLSQRGTHYSPAPDKTQLHHLYLSGALTTAQPLTKHSYTIFISAGHSLQPSPWQNTATPSLSQRGTHYSPAPDKTQLHHLYLSGALTTAQPLTKHSYTIRWSSSQQGTQYSVTPTKTHTYTIFIPAGHSLQRKPQQNTQLHKTLIFIKAGPSLQCNPQQNTHSYIIVHTLIIIPAGYSVQGNAQQNTHSYTIHWSSSQQGTYSVTPNKTHSYTIHWSSSQWGTHYSPTPDKTHTATLYTDLHPSRAPSTA